MTLLPAPGTREYDSCFPNGTTRYELPPAFPTTAYKRRALTDAERWAERRRLYWRTRPRQCAACGITMDIDLHHRHYEAPTGQESDDTLVGLCKPHHRRVHRIHDRITPHDVRPYRHLGWITTMYIARIRFQLSALYTALNLVAGAVGAVTVGLWLPVLIAAATVIAGPVRRKVAR